MGRGTDQVEFAQRFGRRYTTPSAEIELSNEQPLALRLADEVFEWNAFISKHNLNAQCLAEASAELRRQHAEIERLHEERFRESAEQQLEIERLQNELAALRAQAKRLTDEQIREKMSKHRYHRNSFKDGVRFAEQAHGIGLPTKGDSA